MLLYHYTTVGGLIGILTSRTLWATDCRFLNDGEEIEYAKSLFFSEVDKLKLPLLSDGGYRMPARGEWHIRVFVTCFCEEGDLLSQWRGYGADQGYALGFDQTLLDAGNPGAISPVQYGLSDPANYFAGELQSAKNISGHPGSSAAYAAEQMLTRLAIIKHPSFAEEREWRWMRQLGRHSCREGEATVLFRPSMLGPVPYLTHHFAAECLREIIVGPGSYADVRASALYDMLHCHEFDETEIRHSAIPLRY